MLLVTVAGFKPLTLGLRVEDHTIASGAQHTTAT
jgi:hypothetical protein